YEISQDALGEQQAKWKVIISSHFQLLCIYPGSVWHRCHTWCEARSNRKRSCMDHMISSMRMEEDTNHMTERILDLTLEIIYLLTGESFPPVKPGDHLTITVPSPQSMKPKRHTGKKILEVTKKIIELLTGEVPIRCQDVTVTVEEYLEGHMDLSKDVTPPDGSSNGNPPERCPRPLYSRDSTQEDHTILQRGINQSGWKYPVNEWIKEEEDEVGVMEKFFEGHKDPFEDFVIEPFSDTNPPERCPRPLYS
ncbi:hypothetical protein AB205_0194420, partial [Aquarana catesbeiana]